MANKTKSISLVQQFDELMACADILCVGNENVFTEFVGHQMTMHTKLTGENAKLKAENKAMDIKLKHARSSFNYQMQERAKAEEAIKQFEKQFTIIQEIIGDKKIDTLTPEERTSLAFLTHHRRSSVDPDPPSIITDPSVVLSPSEIDPSDLDDDEMKGGKKWKRRRTGSVEPLPNKKRKSNEGTATPTTASSEEDGISTVPSLSPPPPPAVELNMAPPLEKQFKKPPPMGNRRKPTKQYLQEKKGEEVTDLDDAMDVVSTETPPITTTGSEEDTDDPLPSAPPLYPVLPAGTPPASGVEPVDEEQTPVNTPTSSPLVTRSRSDFNMQRQHTFFVKTALKFESINCQVCNSNVKRAHSYLKCQDCRMSCHTKCRSKAPLPCVPCAPTPKRKKIQNLDLAAFCPHTIPRVPAIIVHCVNEIERRGLNSVGLYRICGNDKTIKELRDRLLRTRGHPQLDQITDINVICGVIKDFLRNLREPLLTFALHETFINAASADTNEEGLASTLEAIAKLPPSNKDTLAYLILHLQRVAYYSTANKMPLANLVTVFAPTVVGNGSAKPTDADLLRDAKNQPKVMEKLLGISGDYWRQYLSPMEHPDPTVSPTPSVQSVQSSPALLSPATPELRPVPESPFLGSCQSRAPPTPRLPRIGVTPMVLSHPKRTGNFLPDLN